MSVEHFMYESQREMEASGVEIYLEHNATHVALPSGMKCNGYFIDNPIIKFACATQKPFANWFPIYVHEYGHFTQWRDKIPAWTDVWIDGLYYDNFLDQWLGYRQMRFAPWKVARFIQAGIALESDCERRVIDLIGKHSLPINKEEYAQKANSYVHFYNYIEENRKWYIPGKEPYNLPEVWSQFNTTVDNDFSPNEAYMELYAKHCF